MFKWLSTGTRPALQAVDRLEYRLNQVEHAHKHLLDLLEDRLATLEGQHKTLRGRFYATRSETEGSAPGAISGNTREERRASALAKLRGPIMPPKQ
jgi:hypothetical protein